jgi:hypothetical protein
MNEKGMKELGFERMTALEAHDRWPTASPTGDDVWWYPTAFEILWVQGIPQGPQLFSMIFHAGKRAGDKLRVNAIKDALKDKDE